MTWWQALLLGIVEGLTEYLPVSSTGHLLVAQRLMGIPADEAANAYAIVIQAGAIAAVIGLYRGRVAQLLAGLLGRDRDGLRVTGVLFAAFLPAAICGLVFGDAIEAHLFGPWPIITAWALGGALILLFGSSLKRSHGISIEQMGLLHGCMVGVMQCAALWPGVSRSLATIVGGVLAGLALPAAVEFSFLLGLLTLGAATAYKLVTSGDVMLATYGLLELSIGFVAAWLSAALAVKWMVAWLNQRGFAVFGWWRLFVAAALTAMLLGAAAT